jgi:putative DNA primase/helicase
MSAAEANGVHVAEPPRPVPLRVIPENIPAELRALSQWVVWRYELRAGKGDKKPKWTKPPFAANGGGAASSTDPATWAPFEEALDAYERGGWDGVGLVHVPGDNLGVIDLDHVREGEAAALEPWAAAIVALMDTYAETSPSGTGLRIVARGRKPGRKAKRGPVEIYDGLTADGEAGGRYLTFTGHRLDGVPSVANDRQDQLAEVYQQYLAGEPNADQAAESPDASGQVNGHTKDAGSIFTRLKATWSPPDGPLSDEDLVKLTDSGLDEKLTRLWSGDAGDDHSVADLALCCKLLWWMGGADAGRLDRLFRQSKLMRPKWDEKRGQKTYGRLTIDHAISVQTDYRKPNGDGAGLGEEDGPVPPNTAHAIILAHFREHYRPMFRCADAVFSEAFGREVKRSEAVGSIPYPVIRRLAATTNAPKDRKGNLNVNALPTFAGQWGKVAYGTLLAELPTQDNAEEISAAAEADFRDKLAKGLRHEVTIGETEYHDEVQVTRTERRPVIIFALREARSTRWARFRHHAIWARLDRRPDKRLVPQVAVRAELFEGIGYRPLADMHQNTFCRRCERYMVGDGGGRPTGERAVVLTDEFLDATLMNLDLNDEQATTEGDETCRGEQNDNSDNQS